MNAPLQALRPWVLALFLVSGLPACQKQESEAPAPATPTQQLTNSNAKVWKLLVGKANGTIDPRACRQAERLTIRANNTYQVTYGDATARCGDAWQVDGTGLWVFANAQQTAIKLTVDGTPLVLDLDLMALNSQQLVTRTRSNGQVLENTYAPQ